jgi:hypothetical protein
MTIMSVVMALFTGGMVSMFNVSNKGESLAFSQVQNNTSYVRLDHEIRYASGISTPGAMNGDPVVEYLITTVQQSTGTATATCYELRLHGTTLQSRKWTQNATPPAAWATLATGVTAAAASPAVPPLTAASTPPFTRYPADATFNFQRLRLQLQSSSGLGKTASVAGTDITFTALNTTLGTSSSSVCTEGRAA